MVIWHFLFRGIAEKETLTPAEFPPLMPIKTAPVSAPLAVAPT
jgi:hypothetical protein